MVVKEERYALRFEISLYLVSEPMLAARGS